MLIHVVARVSAGQSFVLQMSIAAAVHLGVVELKVKTLTLLLLHNYSRRKMVLLLSHDWGKRLLMSLACACRIVKHRGCLRLLRMVLMEVLY